MSPSWPPPGSKYAGHAERGQRQEELDDYIALWTAKHNADDLLEMMHEGGVPAGRIYRPKDMLVDPHFEAREAIVRVPDDQFGSLAMQNVVPKMSGTPGSIRWTGAKLGEHNEDVYGNILGIDADQRADLEARGII